MILTLNFIYSLMFSYMNFFSFKIINFIIFFNMYPFIFLNFKFHPMYLNFSLIFMTIFMCLYLTNFLINKIYSFIIFLILIGGLFILFLYFTSLYPNETSQFNFNNFLFIFIFLMLPLNLINFNLFSFNNSIMFEFFNLNFYFNILSKNNLIFIYLNPFFFNSMIIILILLIYLIFIIKIINFNKSINFIRSFKLYEKIKF